MALVGTILVTPEKLNEKSNELDRVITSLAAHLEEMQNIINASKDYWIGKAGDIFRRQYLDMNAEATEILNKLVKYPIELQKMAGIYIIHDDTAFEKAEALPADVLE